MKLSDKEVEEFYYLWWELLKFVNVESGLHLNVPETVVVGGLPFEESCTLRETLWKSPVYIESFINKPPSVLSNSQLDIVSKWKVGEKKKYFILRHLKKHTVFLGTDRAPKAYAVRGLAVALEDVFPYPPVFVESVLLPFADSIVPDGFFSYHNVVFGGGMKRSFNESYREAKAREGIIKQL